MNEPEKEHVLQDQCVIEATIDEFDVIRKAVSYAASFEDDQMMRMKYVSVLADLNQMHQTYQLARERWVLGDTD